MATAIVETSKSGDGEPWRDLKDGERRVVVREGAFTIHGEVRIVTKCGCASRKQYERGSFYGPLNFCANCSGWLK